VIEKKVLLQNVKTVASARLPAVEVAPVKQLANEEADRLNLQVSEWVSMESAAKSTLDENQARLAQARLDRTGIDSTAKELRARRGKADLNNQPVEVSRLSKELQLLVDREERLQDLEHALVDSVKKHEDEISSLQQRAIQAQKRIAQSKMDGLLNKYNTAIQTLAIVCAQLIETEAGSGLHAASQLPEKLDLWDAKANGSGHMVPYYHYQAYKKFLTENNSK